MEDIVRSVAKANRSHSTDSQNNDNEDEFGELKRYDFGFRQNRKFLKQLAKDNIDVKLFELEVRNLKGLKQRKTCGEMILQVMHTNLFQIMLSLFLLIDSSIIISEIVLEIQSLQLSKKKLVAKIDTAKNIFRRLSPVNLTIEDEHEAPVYSKAHLHAGKMTEDLISVFDKDSENITCTIKESKTLNKSHKVSVLGSGNHDYAMILHQISDHLHIISIILTGGFLILCFIKLAVKRRKFFKERHEVIDSFVLLVSFVSDILSYLIAPSNVALMVVLLIWRIIRIINSLFMHEKQRYEFRIALQKKARRLQERQIDFLETDVEMLHKNIIALEELMRDIGCSEEAIKKCKPRYKKCSKEQTNNALKSIAALTTGFMGGLVGAQTAVQRVNTPGSQANLAKKMSVSSSDQLIRSKDSQGSIGSYKKFSSDKTVDSFDPGIRPLKFKKSTSVEYANNESNTDPSSTISPDQLCQSTSQLNPHSSKIEGNLFPPTILESRRESAEAKSMQLESTSNRNNYFSSAYDYEIENDNRFKIQPEKEEDSFGINVCRKDEDINIEMVDSYERD